MTFPTIRRDEFRAPPIVVEVFSRRERGESGVFNVIAAVQVRGNLAVALQSESATHTITNVRIFKADAALVRQAIHAARTVPGRVDVGDLYARNGVRFPIWTRPGVVWFGRQLPTGAPVGKPTAI